MTRRALLTTLILIASACHRVDGGPVVSETRELSAFTRVRIDDGIPARFEPGPARVTLSTQQEVAKNLRTEVKNGTLIVSLKPGVIVDSFEWTEIAITGTDVSSFESTGGSQLEATHVEITPIRVTASGAGQVTISGRTTTLDVSASGAAHVFARELPCETASVDASGASVVEVSASSKVEGSASGASVVTVLGGANTAGFSTSGASTVQ